MYWAQTLIWHQWLENADYILIFPGFEEKLFTLILHGQTAASIRSKMLLKHPAQYQMSSEVRQDPIERPLLFNLTHNWFLRGSNLCLIMFDYNWWTLWHIRHASNPVWWPVNSDYQSDLKLPTINHEQLLYTPCSCQNDIGELDAKTITQKVNPVAYLSRQTCSTIATPNAVIHNFDKAAHWLVRLRSTLNGSHKSLSRTFSCADSLIQIFFNTTMGVWGWRHNTDLIKTKGFILQLYFAKPLLVQAFSETASNNLQKKALYLVSYRIPTQFSSAFFK